MWSYDYGGNCVLKECDLHVTHSTIMKIVEVKKKKKLAVVDCINLLLVK